MSMNRMSLLSAAFIIICLSGVRAVAVTAFPGAEGFGANVTGGRGGTVYHVTNLNNSGTGSFRDAVSASGRTVVFDVGGVINITSPVAFSNNITVAGQTAPGDGIVVYGDAVSLSSRNNIIIRYMTFRMGIAGSDGDKALNMTTSYNIMLDHVSVSWGRWDTFGITSNSHDITIQDSILAEAIDPQRLGGLIDSSRRLTLTRNFFINNQSRNPKGKGDLQYINNVIYNWGSNGYCGGHSAAPWLQDLINNYFIAGPSSSLGSILTQFTETDMVYQTGNYVDLDRIDTNGDGLPEGRLIVESDFIANSTGGLTATFVYAVQNFPPVAGPIMSAADAFPYVLDNAGNSLHRDGVDQRMVTQAKSLGTLGAIINNESMVGGQPAVAGGTPPVDNDQDGMPDYFETALGLSTTVADNNGDYDGDGCTNIEHYMNWLAGPRARVVSGSFVDVDLQQYASSFAVSPTYGVSGATHGTVTLLGDGRTARFTPTTGYSGLAEFDFAVTSSIAPTAGTVTVLVEGSGSPIPLSPDPMTWASVPAAAGLTSITMTATTAASSGGVEYYFMCTAGAGHNSAWQTSPIYVDSGLVPNTSYTYRVKARDKIDTAQETVPSQAASATTRAIPAIADPAAYWLLDETSGTTAHDISGAPALNGTLGGTGLPAWALGKFGNGLTFTANGGRVTVPSSAAIDFGDQDLSVSIWINEPVTIPVNTQHEVFVKGTFGGTYDTGSGKRYEFYRKRDTTSDNFRWTIDDNSTKVDCPIAASLVCTGDWVHVVGIRDTVNNQMRIYVNGALKNTVADGSGSISQTEPLYLGDVGMSASIDDVRVYRYALTQDQISAIYIGAGVPDTTVPTPDPMTWASVPAATGIDTIAMTATAAYDLSGVEYYFTNTTIAGHDSGWQDSPLYTDASLVSNTTYTYRVNARDKSAGHNETGWSDPASASTLRYTCADSIASDLDGNCQVDFMDLALIGNTWAGDAAAWTGLSRLAADWLACNRVPAGECWQ